MSSAASRSREAVTRSLADQLTPVLRLHAEVSNSRRVPLQLDYARTRLAAGRPAFDAAAVVRDAGDLTPMFGRAVSAFELAGLAAPQAVFTVQQRSHDVTELALSWVAGERLPFDLAKRLARRAAGLLGSAILRAAAEQVLAVAAPETWPRATCPCCGGAPDLALRHGTGRSIVCSRCDTRWEARATGCLGCGAEREPTLARIQAPYLGYTLVICHACGHYLKERSANGHCEPLVERALTTELDAAAESRGLRA